MGFLLLAIGGFLLWQFFSRPARADTVLRVTPPTPTVASQIADPSKQPREAIAPQLAALSVKRGMVLIDPTQLGATLFDRQMAIAQFHLKAGTEFRMIGSPWKILKIGQGEFVVNAITGIGAFPLGTEIWSFDLKRVLTLTDLGEGPLVRYTWK